MQRTGRGNTDLEACQLRFHVGLARLKFLIAELRQHLERKAGFDPDQPRDDRGRWADTGAGDDEGHQTVERDPSGEEAWDQVVNDWRADGSLAQQMVFNRDGSTIHSEFNASDAALAWDERHTVVTTDGARIRFETAGTAQTVSDADSGEALGRAVWTDDGPQTEATLQPAFQGPAVEKTIEAGAALFVWLSSKNDADGTAVFAFRANEFKPGDTLAAEAVWVGRLTREETDAACPRHAMAHRRGR